MILDVFLQEHAKETRPVTLTESDLSDLLAALKAGEFTERIRTSLEWILQQLIEAEATAAIGAARYQRSDDRVAQRNGHRPRLLTTPAGDVELAIPKLREGGFFPSLLERRLRIDRALYAVVMEAYVHGVSTRKVDDLLQAQTQQRDAEPGHIGAAPSSQPAAGRGEQRHRVGPQRQFPLPVPRCVVVSRYIR